MLGWFKKKFGKKSEEQAAVEAELPLEAVTAAEEAVPAEAESEAVAGQPSPGEAEEAVVPELSDRQAAPVAAEGPASAATVDGQPAAAAESDVTDLGEGQAAPVHAPRAEQPSPASLEEPVAETAQVFEPDGIPAKGISLEEEMPADLPVSPDPVEAEPVEAEPALAETAETRPIEENRAGEATVAEEVEATGLEAPRAEADQAGADGDQSSETPAGEAVAEAPAMARTQEKPAAKSMFRRLQERLSKTRDSFIYRLDRLFLGKKEIDQDLYDKLEEILITADLGVSTTLALIDAARKKVKRDQLSDPQALKTIIQEQILVYIQASERPAELVLPESGPFVIMVVGVNGVGKTTTIGKIANKFVRSGQSVLMVAGDTFRAAAINQLRIWGERVGVEVVAQNPGADPSAVVFDGLERGIAQGYEVILIDTAGRLHTSVNLMEELKKIKRVINKKLPGAPHEIMLVLDATTGQNGISQAKLFNEAVGVTGLTLTKLDGTAKGGIVANICRETGIPVRFIGIGEQIDDLRDFEASEFVEALFARME